MAGGTVLGCGVPNMFGEPSLELFDMHCHLGFSSDAAEAARSLAELGAGGLSVTVEPGEFERVSAELAGDGIGGSGGSDDGTLASAPASVRVAAGLHPWWVADGRCGAAEIARAAEHAARSAFVGEVGLDFGRARAGTENAQREAFSRIVDACAQGGCARLVSIHAVRAAGEVLDVLERCDLPQRCACVLHWFSGASDELARAVRMGCFFSVGPRMIATKRGRAYARAVPAARLLLETDLPSAAGEAWSAEAHARALRETASALEELCGVGTAARIAQTSRELLLV